VQVNGDEELSAHSQSGGSEEMAVVRNEARTGNVLPWDIACAFLTHGCAELSEKAAVAVIKQRRTRQLDAAPPWTRQSLVVQILALGIFHSPD
jgi:hypothetical protein